MMTGQVLEIAPSDAEKTVKILRSTQKTHKLPLEEVELYGSLVHIVGNNIAHYQDSIAELLRESSIKPGDMTIIEPSLEDVFIACMKKKGSDDRQ
jgi:hypothetical protein